MKTAQDHTTHNPLTDCQQMNPTFGFILQHTLLIASLYYGLQSYTRYIINYSYFFFPFFLPPPVGLVINNNIKIRIIRGGIRLDNSRVRSGQVRSGQVRLDQIRLRASEEYREECVCNMHCIEGMCIYYVHVGTYLLVEKSLQMAPWVCIEGVGVLV